MLFLTVMQEYYISLFLVVRCGTTVHIYGLFAIPHSETFMYSWSLLQPAAKEFLLSADAGVVFGLGLQYLRLSI
jgi:hypothetical protein